jgi:hypothetical protein
MRSDPPVGIWRLISWENRSLDGQVPIHLVGMPWDTSATARMDTCLWRSCVVLESSFRAGDLLAGTIDEKAHATETYVSYCGQYEFRGDTVIHHVELSLPPNWVGVDQERLVEVTENRLTFSTKPIFASEHPADRPSHLGACLITAGFRLLARSVVFRQLEHRELGAAEASNESAVS